MEFLIVLLIVVAASGYCGLRLHRWHRSSSSTSCSGGCACEGKCSPPSTSEDNHV